MSSFLEKQRLDDTLKLDLTKESRGTLDDNDVDHSYDHLFTSTKQQVSGQNKKGKAQMIEWDDELEEMRREKEVADANRGMACLLCLSHFSNAEETCRSES